MRIMYISSSVIPSRTANSIHVMRMCRAFAADGHQVTLLAVRAARGEAVDNDYTYYGVDPCFEIVKCHHPKVRWLGSALHALCAVRAVKGRPRPDLFYARYAYNLVAVSYLGVPMILEVHDVPPSQQVKAMMKRLYRKVHFVRLVAISEALSKEYRRIFPELPPDKIIVAHDGADVPQTHPGSALARWSGRPGALQVGYTGHLYPGRGIELIIALASAMPAVDFHLVGGTDEDIAKWRTIYKECNLFFHGYVPPGEVAEYCAHFEVLLAPYQDRVATVGGRNTVMWMSPLKIFEYMALGKAIICSDLHALREVLTDQVNALLVPPADHDAWVQALSLLKDNPELRAKLGNAARDEFMAHYTWEKRAVAVFNGFHP